MTTGDIIKQELAKRKKAKNKCDANYDEDMIHFLPPNVDDIIEAEKKEGIEEEDDLENATFEELHQSSPLREFFLVG